MIMGIRLRNWLRGRPRLHRIASAVVARATGPYEAKFEQAMLGALRGANCFWDVGANIGQYVRKATDLGVTTVVAIEPSPACCTQLRGLPGAPVVIERALSDCDGIAALNVDAGPLAVSNHLAPATDREGVGVRVARGDTLVTEGVPAPEVMKIDVEGFEGEVLAGMPLLLHGETLTTVCMEVHFSRLQERGLGDTPVRIVDLLRSAGFRLRWVDPSHLVATKGGG